ncbi:MAG: alpha/beta hydrolase family protein [Phenylobacterium sp.]|nr:alpha/beta hydrolase family protein [Phenylobacterium sp.]
MASAPQAAGGMARPVVFDGCSGWLHPAAGRTAVLLCSPWGYEALCLRRAWRMLGDALSAAGYPTLRFDYPGAGDSLGDASNLSSLEPLKASIRRAAGELRARTHAKRLVLIGHGLGASLAAGLARELDPSALGLLAPVVRGREYLRELSVWGLTVAESMQLETEGEPGAVAGFGLPEGLRAEIAVLDLTAQAEALPPSLIVARGRPSESRFAGRLRELGSAVSELTYAGYDVAVSNPTAALPPRATLEAVVDWLAATVPSDPGPARRLHLEPPVLAGADFIETTVRFGPQERLCGVLCEPRAPRRGATVLMLSAGGDPHIGWARGAVDHARELARSGVASLRMDSTDVADAAGPLSGEPLRLYDERHIEDACAGFDWLLARGLGPVLPVGRCSGAFAAFNAAARDDRIADILLVNQLRYIWNRDGDFELASEKIGHYRKQWRQPAKLLMRWLRGEIDLDLALAKLGAAAVALVSAKLQGKARARRRQIRETFGGLQARGVRVNLLISRDREAHEVFRQFFGAEGDRLRRYGDLRLSFLEGADHGLTPKAARDALLDLVRETALTSPGPSALAIGAEPAAAERQDFALRPCPAPGLLPT